MSDSNRTLRVCALYPDLLNIYADRGNLLMLELRCQWRGIRYQQTNCLLGEPLHSSQHDLIYIGGGQDRDQLLCARDLVQVKGDALRAAAEAGVVVLGICGGYQLLGRSYQLSPQQEIQGLGLLDAVTVRQPGPRLIGNVAIDINMDSASGVSWPGPPDRRSHPDSASPRLLAGFENHGGRTHLGPRQAPLGKVVRGFGNDGRSGFEGAVSGSVIGTYLHGPLLPKNAWFADWLIATALRIDPAQLAPLDDALEQQAHLAARRAAGVQ